MPFSRLGLLACGDHQDTPGGGRREGAEIDAPLAVGAGGDRLLLPGEFDRDRLARLGQTGTALSRWRTMWLPNGLASVIRGLYP